MTPGPELAGLIVGKLVSGSDNTSFTSAGSGSSDSMGLFDRKGAGAAETAAGTPAASIQPNSNPAVAK